MVKTNTQKPKKEALDDSYYVKVMEYIRQKGSVDLVELKKTTPMELGTNRQTVLNNLRKLCLDGNIKPHIKITDDKGHPVPKEHEIYFSISVTHFKYPYEIENLINLMCSKNVKCSKDENKVHDAFEKFVKLCEEKQLSKIENLSRPPIFQQDKPESENKHALRLAYSLMTEHNIQSREDFKRICQDIAFKLLT